MPDSDSQLRIAVLGGGVMGETLIAALLRAGHRPDAVVVSEKRSERAQELGERHGVAVVGSVEAVTGADVVLLVVKPQDVPGVLAEVGPTVSRDATVVSLAAGIRIAKIQSALPDGVAVVRAMPNTPAVIGEGMFGISSNDACSAEQLALVVDLLSSGGEVAVVDEAHQDAVTAVSGSGPAYVFYLAEAMIAGGVAAGLDEDTARTLTEQTLIGSARLLAASEDPPAELRRRVTSPNGTTAAAIEAFDAHEVRAGIVAGVEAAARRSRELSGS